MSVLLKEVFPRDTGKGMKETKSEIGGKDKQWCDFKQSQVLANTTGVFKI